METEKQLPPQSSPKHISYLFFQIANYNTDNSGIDLFTNKLKEFQLVRPSGVNIGPNAVQTVSYDCFLEDLNKNHKTISKIRLDGMSDIDVITFSREIKGQIYSKCIPVATLGKIDSFNNNTITVDMLSPDEALVLDGKTNINIQSLKRDVQLTLEVALDYNLKDADKSFLNFLNNQYLTFYDYINIKNETLDHQPFKLFFTEDGIVCTNPKLRVNTNGYGYKVGDTVHLWKSYCKSRKMLLENIKAFKWHGNYNDNIVSENYHTTQFLIPLIYPEQISLTLAHGIDKEGRKIVSLKEPGYEHWIRAEESISFVFFKNVAEQDMQRLWLTSCYKVRK